MADCKKLQHGITDGRISLADHCIRWKCGGVIGEFGLDVGASVEERALAVDSSRSSSSRSPETVDVLLWLRESKDWTKVMLVFLFALRKATGASEALLFVWCRAN